MVFEVVLIMAEKALTEAVGLFEEKMAQGRYKEAAKIRRTTPSLSICSGTP